MGGALAHVEYLLPAFAGEASCRPLTWVASFNRALSLRRYPLPARLRLGELCVRGETLWVLVSTATGRPVRIPAELQRAFPLSRQRKSRLSP